MKFVHSKNENDIVITFTIPKTSTSEHSLVPGLKTEWDTVCVVIEKNIEQATLNYLIYLDYKDTYQAGNTILHFDDIKDAEEFAKEYELAVFYY
jgi:hypothetical protein